MEKVKIICDTTSDLTSAFAKAYNIEVLPLTINFGNEEFKDQVNITPDEIYQKVEETKIYPKTSASTSHYYQQIFKPYLDEGYKIIFMTISSHISSSMNNAILASRELEAEDKIFVIDSLNLSYGTGLQVQQIAEDLQKGLTIEETIAHIKEIQPKIFGEFFIDTMTYLHKGGRCSGLSAAAGKVLGLKPIIKLTDGKMGLYKIQRGKKAIKFLVEELKDDLKHGYYVEDVFVVASKADELVKTLMEELSEIVDKNKVLVKEANSVIACHCGPGTVGIFYVKHEKESKKKDKEKNKD